MRPDDAASSLGARLLGPFEVRVNGRPLPRLRFRKSQAVLALLALRQGCEVERDWLAALLWPDSRPAAALHSLRNCLTDLRHALGPEASRLHSRNSRTLSLELTGAFVDVLSFDAALARGDPEALAEAVSLYRGPLMEGCSEEWVFQERQSREEACLGALETLAGQAQACGDLGAAERYLRRVVAADPLRETAQRALMQVLATSGNYAGAARVYRDLRLRLHREVNSEPDPETTTLFQQLRAVARGQAVAPPSAGRRPTSAGSAPGAPLALAGSLSPSASAAPEGLALGASLFPALPQLAAFPHNLPLQLTRFLGRERELAAVKDLLTTHRLVTLTGVGGGGKTRLALQVAADRLSSFADGVWLVELASVRDPALVLTAVAYVLAVREQPGQPLLTTLTQFLRAKDLLLVLDNFEQVIEAAPRVHELLAGAPEVKVLATSRAPLHLRGEQEYPVPPLDVPDTRRLPPLELLTQYAAIELFCQRAGDVQPEFALTGENAAAVAAIVQRLDGLPLAIELAARRVKLLPPEALLCRLEQRLPLLTGGARDLPARQQTLRATIAWSYNLLTAAEQALFRRLSVFVGGCTLAAAEAVCADCGLWIMDSGLGADPLAIQNPKSTIQNAEVLDGVAALVDQSLLKQEEQENGEPRFVMLETIREFGREKLVEGGEAEHVEQRHLDHYLSLAEEAAPHTYGAGQMAWQKRLEREFDNLRAALEWSLTSAEGAEAALRLVGALGQFWVMGSHLREGREWAIRALAKGRNAPPLVLARALEWGHSFAFWQGDYAEAAMLGAEALHFAREAGDRERISTDLFLVAIVAVHCSELEAAQANAEEGIALAQAEGNRLLIGRHQVVLGLIAWMQGDYAAARTLLRDSLEISRALGEEWHIGLLLALLASVTRREGDYEAARALHQEGLPLSERLGDRRGIGWHLVGMAGVEMEQGRVERAARLLGAAAAALEAVGSPLPPPQQREHDQILEQTEAALSEGAFAAAWAAGRALPLEQATRYALEEVTDG